MQKAYIILAHKNPQQLYRLIQKLDDQQAAFFVHIDKKVSFTGFEQLHYLCNKVIFVKRLNAGWGSFGLVEATLQAMQTIAESPVKFKRIILLSGQDYPIKSNTYINQYFSSSPYHVFIEYFTIPNHDKWQPRGGLFRIDKYFFGFKKHQRLVARALNFLAGYVPVVKRKHPQYMQPYAGAQWWIIDDYALKYILSFVKNNPEYITFHKSTFAPDEVFFHTILLNAKDEKLQKSICNNHLRYMNWPSRYNSHPEVLLKEDISNIKQSEALFARKFDDHVQEDILELVDEM